MATWRLWPATNGGTVTTDASTTDLGVQFTVSQPVTLTGYFIWVPATGSTIAQTFRLWTTTNGTSGTIVGSSTVASGTLTAGAWNFTALSPGVALSPGTTYVASVTYTGAGNHYGATVSYWTTGGGGAAGITSGPLSAPKASSALGTAQGCFNEPSTAGFPATASSNQANFWVNVQVNDGVPLPGQPALPGRTWLRRFHHRQQQVPTPPQPPQTITGTASAAGAGAVQAGTAGFPAIPGAARPGLFQPGNPGAVIGVQVIPTGLPAVTVAQAAQPGATWLRAFRHRQQPQAPPAAATQTATVNAGLASVTASAFQAGGQNIQLSNVTVNAVSPSVALGVNAAVATATANAFQAGGQNIQLATATVTSLSPVAAVGAPSGLASVTASAFQAGGQNVGLATATATAQPPNVAIAVNAGLATVTCAALQAGGQNVGLATVTVTALQPQVTTSGSTNARRGSLPSPWPPCSRAARTSSWPPSPPWRNRRWPR